jgi:hypothetical protein
MDRSAAYKMKRLTTVKQQNCRQSVPGYYAPRNHAENKTYNVLASALSLPRAMQMSCS